MARLIRFILILAVGAAVVGVASWGLAVHRVDVLLGDPPPQMGSQTTTFLWDGMAQAEGHPRVWRFAFAPTVIPGARSVNIYITPLGHIELTEPADLAARVKVFHNTGY
jgi:hypothetical protein